MAAGKFKMYEEFLEAVQRGEYDLDPTGTYKVALFLSTSNANTLSTAKVLADLTNQHANANGYTSGGVTVAATLVQSGAVTTFDSADAQWTASGGSITARFAVVYRVGTFGAFTDPLIGVTLLDTTPADVTATDTNNFTVQMNASGIFAYTAPSSDA